MAQSNIERQLRAGIRAAQQNNLEQARTLLEGVLRQDRNNELAWIWMASVVPSKREKRVCLERVLQINPENEPARDAINSLVGVVGESGINYTAIANAAKIKLPASAPQQRAVPGAGVRDSRGGLGSAQTRMLLGVVAIVLGLLLAASFIVPALIPDATPTEIVLVPTEPEVTAEVTEAITVTLGPPTQTPLPGVVVTRGTRPPLETNTPTVTNTPTITPTATATLPTLDDYLYLFISGEDLYRVDLADGPRPVVDDMVDFDVRAGTLGFIRVTGTAPVEGEEAASQALAQLFYASLSNPEGALQVTRLESGAVTSLSMSPDGTQIVYASNEDGDEELFIVELATGITQRLTDNTTDDTDPHWSPDGRQIVYASDAESPGTFDLMLLNVADRTASLLEDTTNSLRSPRWSPDGTQIVYTSIASNSSELFVMEMGQFRSKRQLTFDGVTYLSPDWTPDGRYIIYISSQEGAESRLVIRAENGSRVDTLDTGTLQPSVVIAEP